MHRVDWPTTTNYSCRIAGSMAATDCVGESFLHPPHLNVSQARRRGDLDPSHPIAWFRDGVSGRGFAPAKFFLFFW
jgi:hypothetical protein